MTVKAAKPPLLVPGLYFPASRMRLKVPTAHSWEGGLLSALEGAILNWCLSWAFCYYSLADDSNLVSILISQGY